MGTVSEVKGLVNTSFVAGAREGHGLGRQGFQPDAVSLQAHSVKEGGRTLGDVSEGRRRVALELGEGEASHQRVAGVVPAAFFIASVALALGVAVDPASVASENITSELGGELIQRELSVQLLLESVSLLLSDLSLNQVNVGLDCLGLLLHREGVEVALDHLGYWVAVLDAEVNEEVSVGGQAFVGGHMRGS